MFVSPISFTPQLYGRNNIQKNNTTSTASLMANQADKVSFSGFQPMKMIKNKLGIYMSQDIWAPKLMWKLPETDVEKEVMLEVLQHRQNLDRFVELSEKRFMLRDKLNKLNELKATKPRHIGVTRLNNELAPYGNVEETIKAISKEMETEIENNRASYDFFRNLDEVEGAYRRKRYLKTSNTNDYWNKVVNNNINSDGRYTTAELIEIVKNTEPVGLKDLVEVARVETKLTV